MGSFKEGIMVSDSNLNVDERVKSEMKILGKSRIKKKKTSELDLEALMRQKPNKNQTSKMSRLNPNSRNGSPTPPSGFMDKRKIRDRKMLNS
jgi:hypothetical protein